MKSTASIVLAIGIALSAVGVATGQSSGQSAPNRNESNVLPQGRFLKRLRDDAAEREKKRLEDEGQSARSGDPRRTGTSEGRSTTDAAGRAPDPTRSATGLTPPPNQSTRGTALPTTQQNAASRPGSSIPVSQPPRSALPAPANQRNTPAADHTSRDDRRPGPKPVGFGWKLDERNDRLVVTHVDRTGNAEKIGVRPGDVVLEMGGIPIANLEEYRQIVEIFGEGDEISVKLERSNRPFERDLQFGAAPEVDADVIAPGNGLPSSAPTGPATARPASSARSPNGVNDFAPPIVTPSAANNPRAGQSPSSLPTSPDLANRMAPNARPAVSQQDYDIQRLQLVIRQQQETIRQLQQELESLKKRSQQSNPRGLFGR